jgi:hypothetical protein
MDDYECSWMMMGDGGCEMGLCMGLISIMPSTKAFTHHKDPP